eukprot:g2430.t1
MHRKSVIMRTIASGKETGKGRRKWNVLCLHGWRTNGDILRMQMRDVVKDNRERVVFTFANAPFEATGPPHDIVAKIWPPTTYTYYEWWDRVDDRYEGLDRSIEYLKELNAEKGPFDGVVGFSQGAALASVLCKKHTIETLKFGILFSGFIPRDRDLRVLFSKKSKSNVPIFLSTGERDADYCLDALEAFPKTFAEGSCVVARHPGGHELPLRTHGGGDALIALRSFLAKVGADNREARE